MTWSIYGKTGENPRIIRARIILRKWGISANRGAKGKGYPTSPPWQHLLGGCNDEKPEEYEVEKCGQLIGRYPPDKKSIIHAYWADLFHKVKRHRDLPRAVVLTLKNEKVDKKAVEITIEDIELRVANEILA